MWESVNTFLSLSVFWRFKVAFLLCQQKDGCQALGYHMSNLLCTSCVHLHLFEWACCEMTEKGQPNWEEGFCTMWASLKQNFPSWSPCKGLSQIEKFTKHDVTMQQHCQSHSVLWRHSTMLAGSVCTCTSFMTVQFAKSGCRERSGAIQTATRLLTSCCGLIQVSQNPCFRATNCNLSCQISQIIERQLSFWVTWGGYICWRWLIFEWLKFMLPKQIPCKQHCSNSTHIFLNEITVSTHLLTTSGLHVWQQLHFSFRSHERWCQTEAFLLYVSFLPCKILAMHKASHFTEQLSKKGKLWIPWHGGNILLQIWHRRPSVYHPVLVSKLQHNNQTPQNNSCHVILNPILVCFLPCLCFALLLFFVCTGQSTFKFFKSQNPWTLGISGRSVDSLSNQIVLGTQKYQLHHFPLHCKSRIKFLVKHIPWEIQDGCHRSHTLGHPNSNPDKMFIPKDKKHATGGCTMVSLRILWGGVRTG